MSTKDYLRQLLLNSFERLVGSHNIANTDTRYNENHFLAARNHARMAIISYFAQRKVKKIIPNIQQKILS